ncbi:phosphoenolpyruvate carboxykinase (ATP) [Sphingomonas qomolangmaensis]|uniref:Serine kinase n=1 Tax=Sphingomonas qomolangmaensis TaxID=2918765 RepID=A0ABY5LCG4_9SPHN|nr:serine kinase [Sphingomonas qomolangmaensis]UUL82381.1 serine kinase [Sphingomonas qomolangmaensis]
MNRYRAFGLLIESDFLLPELSIADSRDGPCDLRIVRADIGREIPEPNAQPVFDYEDPSGTVMIWPQVAGFRFRAPDLIEVEPAPNAKSELLAFPLLGPVMGWFLHLRGRMVLHASAVVWRGLAFGFLGDKLAGKSTTAAAFLRDGAQLLTDDLLVFAMDDPAVPLVQPAFAQLKLGDDSAAAVTIAGAKALPLVMDGFAKRQHRLHRLAAAPAACDALFILERGDGPAVIEWLDQKDAFLGLMRFGYNVRFANAPIAMQNRQRNFEQCVALARSLRFGVLRVPADLTRLDEVLEAVAESLAKPTTA